MKIMQKKIIKNTKIKNNYIDIIYDYNKSSKEIFNFSIKNLSNKIFDFVLSKENINIGCEISLFVVDNKYIKKTNKAVRNINRVTDVLSFPLIDFSKIKDINKYIKKTNSYIDFYNYDTDRLTLGDVIISADKVLLQAKKYNHSIKREFSFLLTHSILHLLGYDHMIKKEEDIMFTKQSAYLDELGIIR